MATQLPPDFQTFTEFMEHRYRNGTDPTLENGVQAFREYERQLADLRARIQEAQEQVARGENGPIDIEEIIKEINDSLAAKGIPE